jgi:phosphatidate cytidylyltransferase
MVVSDHSLSGKHSGGAFNLRVAAAVILVPAAVAWALFSPLYAFVGIGTAILMVGAWEWSALAGLAGIAERLGYLLAMLILMALAWWAFARANIEFGLLVAFSLFWLLSTFTLRFAPIGASPAGLRVQGLVVIVSAWFGFIAVRDAPHGPRLVLALLFIVWAADIGAYFVGRAWGRHKLAPRISPGKTWEGFVGGLGAAVVAGAIASLWSGTPIAVLAPLALAAGVFSVIGDLVESRLKRGAGAKDSSHLIPGHGGLLDRIDSLCAAAPVFALGLEIAGHAR